MSTVNPLRSEKPIPKAAGFRVSHHSPDVMICVERPARANREIGGGRRCRKSIPLKTRKVELAFPIKMVCALRNRKAISLPVLLSTKDLYVMHLLLGAMSIEHGTNLGESKWPLTVISTGASSDEASAGFRPGEEMTNRSMSSWN
jgi:hypothetical protein